MISLDRCFSLKLGRINSKNQLYIQILIILKLVNVSDEIFERSFFNTE